MTNPLRISRDWVYALGFGAFGLILRFWNLDSPKGKIFDEVYYAANAQSLLENGVEIDSKTGLAQFIVHPPTGKWLIAIGIKLFGYNEFGWRSAAALVGSLSIILMYFTAKKLFNNRFLSVLAASLISMDGLHLVHSRVALLDIFLLFFIQIAVLAFLHQKYWISTLALGLATSVKWSGLYVLIALAFLVLVTDFRKHRFLGSDHPFRELVRRNLLFRFLQFAIFPTFVYVASWFGWFATNNGWDRNFSSNPLLSFWHYHVEILNFHTELRDPHPYSANPWSWLIQGRPTSFFYETPKNCGGINCSQEILALGTPVLWWAATIALLVTIGIWVSKRDWQAEILLIAIGASYLPWFAIQERTMFSFYAVAFEPFILLTLVFVVSKIVKTQRKVAAILVAIVLANFLYFLPIFLGLPLTYNSWHDRMWLPSWI
ncbi:MAG: phospholipid carrier-dependent glycosyltransferase [Actinomycetes bacterium]|tara:strand:+ start:102 stop:1394 length:1293 start_codon:yes stop_codon:yes gene_type:complete